MMELEEKFEISDIPALIYNISSHLSFLLERKIIKYASASYDLSMFNLEEMVKNKGVEDTIADIINEFFLEPLSKKFDSEVSLKRKKEILSEYEFVAEEIMSIIDLYLEKKKEYKRKAQEEQTLSVSRFFAT
ncbi:MAG: hypothetical protein QXX30_00085 [Candidatus Aenigmatarchaeota archaeon]